MMRQQHIGGCLFPLIASNQWYRSSRAASCTDNFFKTPYPAVSNCFTCTATPYRSPSCFYKRFIAVAFRAAQVESCNAQLKTALCLVAQFAQHHRIEAAAATATINR
jgi:hypothetical protein